MNFGSQDTKICFVRLKLPSYLFYFGYFMWGRLRLRGAESLVKVSDTITITITAATRFF